MALNLFSFVTPGSQTLFHWQQLARPNLGTILDPRPGVVTKGFTPLTDDTVHHISDLEEDDEEEGEGGITFQAQQSFPEEKKCALAKPVAGIFLPPITSAAVPLTGKKHNYCFLLIQFSSVLFSVESVWLCGNAVFAGFVLYFKKKDSENQQW